MKSPFLLPILLLTVFVFANAALAQDEPIKVDTSVVRLNVGVVDKRGHPMVDLNQSSFDVYEDGVKQQITHFEPTVTPFSVVLMLDMSGSTLGFRQVLKQSATRFLDTLAPEDRVAVIEFNEKPALRNDFTSNRATIANSINVANGRGHTELYKALDFALDKLAKEKSRRKAIIVLTDGVDTSARDLDRAVLDRADPKQMDTAILPDSNPALDGVLNRADAQGVTIYPLALPTGDPAKLADPTPAQIAMFKAARERLAYMANRSGGRLNAINRLEEMGRLYAEVAAEIRTLYTIEYTSPNEKRDGKWREIRIDVRDPNLISRTRQGYYAK
ncbi:MAG: VWA domain-containing protein [Pyrinomonadaceae bacterium]